MHPTTLSTQNPAVPDQARGRPRRGAPGFKAAWDAGRVVLSRLHLTQLTGTDHSLLQLTAIHTLPRTAWKNHRALFFGNLPTRGFLKTKALAKAAMLEVTAVSATEASGSHATVWRDTALLLPTAATPVWRPCSFHPQTFPLVFSGCDSQATLQMSPPSVLTDTFQATPRPNEGYQGMFECGPPSPGEHSGGVSEL